jgi:hypothetical protein
MLLKIIKQLKFLSLYSIIFCYIRPDPDIKRNAQYKYDDMIEPGFESDLILLIINII